MASRKLVFLGQGRLGNQVFQWVALRHRFADCEFWAPGWATLHEVFEIDTGLHLRFRNPLLQRLLRRKLGRLLMRLLFGSFRLGHYVYEPALVRGGRRVESGRLVHRRGLLEFVYVDGGYYQNLLDLLRPADFQALHLRERLHRRALEVLQQSLGPKWPAQAWPQIVMHVRRGDYLQFEPYGLPDVTLPAGYYLRAGEEARRDLSGPQAVLVVTDDAPWCRRELGLLGEFEVVSNSEVVDFAILTMFPIVVIANSTFSLAAACVGPAVRRVIAPRFWFGHRVGQWLPAAICSVDPRFTYI